MSSAPNRCGRCAIPTARKSQITQLNQCAPEGSEIPAHDHPLDGTLGQSQVGTSKRKSTGDGRRPSITCSAERKGKPSRRAPTAAIQPSICRPRMAMVKRQIRPHREQQRGGWSPCSSHCPSHNMQRNIPASPPTPPTINSRLPIHLPRSLCPSELLHAPLRCWGAGRMHSWDSEPSRRP